MDGISMLTVLGGFLGVFWSFYRFGIIPQFDAIKKKIEENSERLGEHRKTLNEHSNQLSAIKNDLEWLKNNSGGKGEKE